MEDSDLAEDPELIAAVLSEGIDALEKAIVGFDVLRTNPTNMEPLDALFRGFHSVKGNTAMVGLMKPSRFAHVVEDFIQQLSHHFRRVDPPDLAFLEEAVDLLVAILQAGGTGGADDDVCESFYLRLAEHAQHPLLAGEDGMGNLETATVRRDGQRRSPPSTESSHLHEKDGEDYLRVTTTQLRGVEELAGDLFHLAERLSRSPAVAQGRSGELGELVSALEGTTNLIYERLTDMQRIAPTNLTRSLARLVRDVCRKTGKKVDFKVVGNDLRIDRRVVTVVRDGLVHLVRNAVDHGVESAAERAQTNKPEVATITITIEDREDMVSFCIDDDGRGIDLQRVRDKAISLGLVDAEGIATLSESEIIEFIYHPGFSTAVEVSELSGRGVGMNVVAADVRGAGGSVHARTQPGKGTRFELVVPKVGSPVVEGLAFCSGGSFYLVRMQAVVGFVDWREVKEIRCPGGSSLIRCDAGTLPLLELPLVRAAESTNPVALVLCDSGNRRAVLRVDEVLGRHRVLTIPVSAADVCLGRRVDAFILGGGDIGCLVEVDDLLAKRFAVRGAA